MQLSDSTRGQQKPCGRMDLRILDDQLQDRLASRAGSGLWWLVRSTMVKFLSCPLILHRLC